MNHTIASQAYKEMITEATDKNYYANWASRAIGSSVEALGQIKRDLAYKSSGAGSDSYDDKEKATFKKYEKQVNDLIISIGKLYKDAGKIRG